MDISLALVEVENQVVDLRTAFEDIQQPRSDFQIEHFVIGQHDTDERSYVQCVLELQAKYDGIKRAMFKRERIFTQLESMNCDITSIDYREIMFELEVLDRSLLGMTREFKTLYTIWKSMPKFTYNQIQGAEERYWRLRLKRQATQDLNATGRVGVGNQEAIAQAGWGLKELVEGKPSGN